MPWTPTTGFGYADSIDARLNPSPTGEYKKAFSTFSTAGNTSVYNSNLWGGGGAAIDFTGIEWGSTGYARNVAITRRHIIVSEHGSQPIDTDLYFIKADGTLVTIQASAAIRFVGKSEATDPTGVSSFRVMYLKSDLPAGIAIYPVAADPASLLGNPMVRFDQEGKALIADISLYGDLIGLSQPADPTRATYYEDVVGGDSGSPAFFLSGTQLIYSLGLTTSSSAGGRGPNTATQAPAILAACAELDAAGANTGYAPTFYNPLNRLRSSAAGRPSLGLGLTL